MTSVREFYQALPLDPGKQQIRLLHLQPGRYSDHLQCRLSITSLATKTPDLKRHESGYQALSYTWGSNSNLQAIWLQGARIEITLNLLLALRRLRRTDRERVLWVDAVCINQDDLPERGQQVRIMDLVYAMADEVVVWLGDSGSGRDTIEEGHDWTQTCQHHFSEATEKTTPSWWQRAWTIQEYVLSQNQPLLCFGPCEHRVSEYHTYYSQTTTTMQAMPFGNITSALSLNEDQRITMAVATERPHMITILEQLSKHSATNSRDYVYCLLGLISKDEAMLINPDYEVKPEVVFARATYAAIAGSGSLEIMKRAGLHPSRPQNLPSWAVDFDPKQRTLRGTWGDPRSWPTRTRSMEMTFGKVQASIGDESMRLILQGSVLSSVARILFRRKGARDETLSCDISAITQLLEKHPQNTSMPVTRSEMVSLAKQIANFGRGFQSTQPGQSARDFWRREIKQYGSQVFHAWSNCFEAGLPASPRSTPRWDWDDESGIAHDHGMTFFILESGFLCIYKGDLDVQEGDVVALPCGSQFPMLLQVQRDSSYRFAGFVYLHGMTEAMLRSVGSDDSSTMTSLVLS